MSAILKKGLDFSLPINAGTTIAALRRDSNFQAVAQYSANDLFRVGGCDVADEYAVVDGDIVTVEKAVCEKAG